MQKTLRLAASVALVGLLAACEDGTDWQRAGLGAVAGAGVATVAGTSIATGVAVGAAAGALSDDAARLLR
ncbi:hypothetical protein [Aliiruegeria lutimaris]|uniref:Lipoprotein n=1 Tax=Aliiruegeria lutimaris TaxID=571298 RepID=A0A1G8Z4X7_9RHOB|nr:hypothetical protein [Aliiruegeria lutimaris]SDK10027.1 hypothetical protein SAMN04488026_103110 [Aliiruegeria lutimaris]